MQYFVVSMFCGGFLVCLFTLYHNTVNANKNVSRARVLIIRCIMRFELTYIKVRNFFALKLKFFLEKFWCFGKKSYLCIRFQEVTC